jgi:hypothetical protein
MGEERRVGNLHSHHDRTIVGHILIVKVAYAQAFRFFGLKAFKLHQLAQRLEALGAGDVAATVNKLSECQKSKAGKIHLTFPLVGRISSQIEIGELHEGQPDWLNGEASQGVSRRS